MCPEGLDLEVWLIFFKLQSVIRKELQRVTGIWLRHVVKPGKEDEGEKFHL